MTPTTDAGADPGGDPGTSARRRAPRRSLLLQGLGAALVAGGLAGLSIPGPAPLLVGVAVLQLFLVLGVLVLLDAPSSRGTFAIAAVAAAAGSTMVLTSDGSVDALAGVLGLSLIAALVMQIARKDRVGVTESLADTLLVGLLVTAATCFLAVRDRPGGDDAVLVGLAAAGTALLVGRLVDLFGGRPSLVPAATRGWPGLLLGLGAGVIAASVVARSGEALTSSHGALIGLAVAATALTADLAVDLAACEPRVGRPGSRRLSALTSVTLLLPYAVLAPVCLLASSLALPSA